MVSTPQLVVTPTYPLGYPRHTLGANLVTPPQVESQDAEGDPLASEDGVQEQLEALPPLMRFQYEDSCRLLCGLFEPLTARYSQARERARSTAPSPIAAAAHVPVASHTSCPHLRRRRRVPAARYRFRPIRFVAVLSLSLLNVRCPRGCALGLVRRRRATLRGAARWAAPEAPRSSRAWASWRAT